MTEQTGDNLAAILATKAELLSEEKLLLYSLVRGLKPQSVLEIGVFEGGSSSIILQAMGANGSGRLYSIDPEPQVPTNIHNAVWTGPGVMELGRWHLIRGRSPEAIAQLVTSYKDVAPFDFVFIDGDHGKQAVIADIEGAIPYLTDEAYLLFHDAFAPGVEDGIEHLLTRQMVFSEDAGIFFNLSDCGMLCNTFVYLEHMRANYYGMRLLRFERG